MYVECAVGEPRTDGSLIALHIACYYGHIAPVENQFVPIVAQGVLCLFVLGEHHQAGSVPVQSMYYVDAIPSVFATQVFIENGAGGALFLAFSADREEPRTLINNDEVSIFVDDFQQIGMKLVRVLVSTDLYLHPRLEGEVVLGGDDIIHKDHALRQKRLELCPAGLGHYAGQEGHQFHRLADEVVRVLVLGFGVGFLFHKCFFILEEWVVTGRSYRPVSKALAFNS